MGVARLTPLALTWGLSCSCPWMSAVAMVLGWAGYARWLVHVAAGRGLGWAVQRVCMWSLHVAGLLTAGHWVPRVITPRVSVPEDLCLFHMEAASHLEASRPSLSQNVTCSAFYSSKSVSLPGFKGWRNQLFLLVGEWQGHLAEEDMG